MVRFRNKLKESLILLGTYCNKELNIRIVTNIFIHHIDFFITDCSHNNLS